MLTKLINAVASVALRTVSVRYSHPHNAWAIVDKKNPEQVIETIEAYPAYLVGVKFETAQVRRGSGCGSHSEIVGLATGKLTYSRPRETQDSVPCNLSFRDGRFQSCTTTITEAKAVRLSRDRFATIWP